MWVWKSGFVEKMTKISCVPQGNKGLETFYILTLSKKKLNPHESNIPAFHY